MDKGEVKKSIQHYADDLGEIGEMIQEFDPETKAELAEIDEIEDGEVDITADKEGKSSYYSIDDKVKALLYLEIYQREYGDNVMTPKYRFVGRLLDIDESTLRGWWRRRKEINLAGCKFVDKVDDYLKLMMTGILIKATKELMGRDYHKENLKDVNITVSTIFNKLRLLNKLSTKNVAHKHSMDLSGTVPEEEV